MHGLISVLRNGILGVYVFAGRLFRTGMGGQTH